MIDVTKKNIWQSAKSEGLTEAMRLCGCDEFFLNGQASDYECLCELLTVAHKLKGHKALDGFLAVVNNRVGETITYDALAVENAPWIWTLGAQGKLVFATRENENIVEKYNFENKTLKLNDIKKEHNEFDFFVGELKKEISREKSGAFARLTAKSFAAPNPYLAKRIYDNCQKIQDDVLLCQILCEIMLDENCRKAQIYIDTNGNIEYIRSYVAFLKKHNMRGCIYLMVRPNDDVDNILDACRDSDKKCFVNPCIVVTNNYNDKIVDDFKSRLSKVYPIGMLTVIE